MTKKGADNLIDDFSKHGIAKVVVPCFFRNVEVMDAVIQMGKIWQSKLRMVFGLKEFDAPETLAAQIRSSAIPLKTSPVGDVESAAIKRSAIFNRLKSSTDADIPKLSAIFKGHPVWELRDIVPGSCLLSFITLVSMMVDPRRFYHPFHPSRLSRLFQYYYVVPGEYEAMAKEGACGLRAASVMRCWNNGSHLEFLKNPEAPEYFLWRGLNPKRVVEPKTAAKASRKYLRLIYHFWCGKLARHQEARFDPKRYFATTEEVRWFERKIAGEAPNVLQ
jgi:hypothetical protein